MSPALEQKPTARVLSVNVGKIQPYSYKGRSGRTAIAKVPVEGPVAARGDALTGDHQADRKHHGGTYKAVYAYAVEDKRWWRDELGRPFEHGCFGENLTLEGVNVSEALIGERWQIGTAVLEVAGPRIPCKVLAAHQQDSGFPRRFVKAGRPGAYLRIAGEGELAAGDEVRVIDPPEQSMTLRELFWIYTQGREGIERISSLARVDPEWRSWARERLESRAKHPASDSAS